MLLSTSSHLNSSLTSSKEGYKKITPISAPQNNNIDKVNKVIILSFISGMLKYWHLTQIFMCLNKLFIRTLKFNRLFCIEKLCSLGGIKDSISINQNWYGKFN